MRERVLGLALAVIVAGWGGVLPRCEAQGAGGVATALLFDETTKELKGPPGATNFTYTFSFTNSAPGEVVIDSVRTSCGCTVAKVPTLPWKVAAGGAGEFSVVLDARGKRGTISKSVFVNSSIGVKPLTIRAIIESSEGDGGAGGAGGGMEDRLRNMQIAMADRFAVFRGECASCHATPSEGKHGPALYVAACGICHDSHNRASMVPDLKNLAHATDRDHWAQWITFGRHGSMMPAFGQLEGGPLTETQVDSLSEYLAKTISDRRVARVGPWKMAPPPLPGVGTTAVPQ